jgi:hypothetical protein
MPVDTSEKLIDCRLLGKHGVNVDKDPLALDPQELQKAQNAIQDPLGYNAGIRKRPGFTPFNLTTMAGSIRGGISVPLTNLSLSGTPDIYLGRGPIS